MKSRKDEKKKETHRCAEITITLSIENPDALTLSAFQYKTREEMMKALLTDNVLLSKCEVIGTSFHYVPIRVKGDG